MNQRQCARILAGMLWVLIRDEEVDIEAARQTVEQVWRVSSGVDLDKPELATNEKVVLVLACWKTGVWDLAEPDAVTDALLWWAKSPSGWRALEGSPSEQMN